MKSNSTFSKLKPIIVLTLISVVMAALLAATNMLTSDKISAITKKNETEAVAKVIPAEKYEEKTISVDGVSKKYFTAIDKTDNKIVGYAFTVSAYGYGGNVTAVVGIDTNGKITAVEITDVSGETPGLGQNAKQKSFYDGYKGKTKGVSVVKSSPKDNEIKAVTGATITSNAVTKSINSAFDIFEKVCDKGEGVEQ